MLSGDSQSQRSGVLALMGRAGIEPATLGLKVRAELLRRGATDGKVLQVARSATAPSCNELRLADASPYSNRYSEEPPLGWREPRFAAVANWARVQAAFSFRW